MIDATEEQEQLRWFMSRISSDCFAAGWVIGNEWTLWEFMNGKPLGKYPPLMEEGVRLQLLDYHYKAGGWVVWDDKAYSNVKFVTTEEFLQLLDSREQAR